MTYNYKNHAHKTTIRKFGSAPLTCNFPCKNCNAIAFLFDPKTKSPSAPTISLRQSLNTLQFALLSKGKIIILQKPSFHLKLAFYRCLNGRFKC